MNRHEVTVDSRGRVSLDFRVHREHKFYVAEETEDGVITLIPAALVPALRITPTPVEPNPVWTDSFPYGMGEK